MTHQEQIHAFTAELMGVLDRFRSEFDLPTASAIGCLEMVKLSVFHQAMKDQDDDE